MPPEVFGNEHVPYDGIKVDVWCLGVSLLYLLIRQNIWNIPASHDKNFLILIINNRLEDYLSNVLKFPLVLTDLLVNMLKFNPEERFSSLQVLNHPWVRP